MKKLISILSLFLIAASFLPNLTTNNIYLPVVMKSVATPTQTPTVTPTPTPPPGAPPIITWFNCFQNMNYVNCSGGIQNVGNKPISDVTIEIILNNQSTYYADTGSGLIQPGGGATFSLNTYYLPQLNYATASIYSWIEH